MKSTPDEQAEIDEKVTALAALETGDVVDLVTDAGSLAAEVMAVDRDEDHVSIHLDGCDTSRSVRVWTEKYRGWLDPLVDSYTVIDSDQPQPEGSLVDVELVASMNDQRTHHGPA